MSGFHIALHALVASQCFACKPLQLRDVAVDRARNLTTAYKRRWLFGEAATMNCFERLTDTKQPKSPATEVVRLIGKLKRNI